MSATYQAVQWNRQKRLYDFTLVGLLLLALALFIGLTLLTNPNVTVETLILRGTSVSALFLLHVILAIGPLARLDPRFLPLLYNRRHLGVTMFLLALVHAVFAVIQFHALGDTNPLVSVFTAYQQDYRLWANGSVNVAHFPFEPLGAFALVILFVMAATSHDFWLKNLGASFWKTLHLLVYAAYGLVLGHVALGILQSEHSVVYPVMIGLGFALLAGLHLASAQREHKVDVTKTAYAADGFAEVARVEELCESRAKVAVIGGSRVAVWRHEGKVFATANVCRHQGGPVGEGKIIDGCITCPWHGWNYRPEDGCSPPPFDEVIATYETRIVDGRVWVKARSNPLRQRCEGAEISRPFTTKGAPQ
jgi:DMSO/TMAO reductase YedYZ heme-binding membrane subunit/nitrite reductase/ring-hydroxylating ferredoxin subunit